MDLKSMELNNFNAFEIKTCTVFIQVMVYWCTEYFVYVWSIIKFTTCF